MNPNVPLDIFLPPEQDFSHVNLICTNDHNGLNNGAFMIRVGEWGVRYFVDSLALHTYKPDLELKYSEQSAMETLISVVRTPETCLQRELRLTESLSQNIQTKLFTFLNVGSMPIEDHGTTMASLSGVKRYQRIRLCLETCNYTLQARRQQKL